MNGSVHPFNCRLNTEKLSIVIPSHEPKGKKGKRERTCLDPIGIWKSSMNAFPCFVFPREKFT